MPKSFRLDGRGTGGNAALGWREYRNLPAGWKIKESHGKVQTTAAGLRDGGTTAGLRDGGTTAELRDCGTTSAGGG